ncbi:diguanylate cyclase regulator RdcB family protein [Shewanella xiamenensis]|uniref:diguanylate cyclase regulator RdcB family protein n=1 Tax=Shewanella xiamenensis TaxID=332186 RepID=UPI0015598361|nr:diguanylate cyclase regulator RdcB family protein [Shewanella xiamenensis]
MSFSNNIIASKTELVLELDKNDPVSEEVLISLPSLKQKFLVDLVNGIDISKDHIKVQHSRNGFFNRLWDSYTGASARRQNQVNDMLTTGLDSSLRWLTELTKSQAFTNTALVKVNQRLNRLHHEVAEVANFAADTRQVLDELTIDVNHRLSELESKLRVSDLRQRAYQQSDSLFNRWGAERFNAFSPAQRCYLLLTELAWGEFGSYCQIAGEVDRKALLNDLHNRLVERLNKDMESAIAIQHHVRINSDLWFNQPCVNSLVGTQYQQALSFLGDQLSRESHPFSWYVLNGKERPRQVPFLMSSARLVKGLSNDFIMDERLYAC